MSINRSSKRTIGSANVRIAGPDRCRRREQGVGDVRIIIEI
jgi:hypothetical protein